MKEVLKLRKRRTGQWVTVAGTVLVGAYMVFGNSVVFADDTQTYPIEVSDSNKFNLTDSPSLLSSENLGTNNREQEVATFATTGLVDSSTETTPEHMMSESSTVSLSTSDVATSETSTSALASLSEVKSQSETMVEHSINSKNEEESGDDLIYNIHNQEVIITAIKRKETVKKIIIPQKISNYRVTEIGSEAFSYSSLNEVVLPSTLRKIGDGAFRGTHLTRLTLPEGVTEIGYEAFSYSSLNEVVLPSTLTKIGAYAFRGTQLKNVTLPTSITDMGFEAFGGIDSLNSVFIPKKLSNANGAFLGSQHLQRIHFEEGITKIVDGLFQGSGISSIRIPETVTEIGSYAFLNSRITNLYIPDSVTKLGSNSFGHYGVHENAFPTLTKVSLPSQLSSASSPFEGQRNLKEVVFRGDWKIIPNGLLYGTGIEKLVIPEGVTEIGSKAFFSSSLNEVVLPSTLRKIGDEAFAGTKLTRLTLPEGVTEIGSEAFYASSLNEVVLPSTLTKIGNGAFRFTQLKEVVLPSNLTKIGASAFSFTQLKNVTLPTSITDMGIGAFGEIDSLSSVFIPKKLSNAQRAFSGSKHLQRIHFEEGITKIVDGLFQDSGISSIRIPETVTEIGSDAFLNSRITELYIPDSVTKLGYKSFGHHGGYSEYYYDGYYYDFPALTKVSLPSQLSSVVAPFEGQKNLKEVVFRGDWKIIPNDLLYGTGIEKLVIPEGVTSIKYHTLANIPTLKSVYFPKSLKTFVDSWDIPLESVECHVYLDSIALEYVIEKQLNFKLRDENVANDDSKVLDSSNSYYVTTATGTRRQGYLGLDLKYAIKNNKSSDDGRYVIHLNIPDSTKVFDSKVRVDGQDVEVTVSNGYIDIPVSGKTGKVKLTLMTENRALTNVRLFAQLSYQKGSKKISENIGAINVFVPFLTLIANRETSRSYSRITGITDPNDQLIAYLDDVAAGQIKVKKDGSYSFDVPLVDPVDNKEYTIKVVSISSAGQGISETATVRYEKKTPELTNFTMRHNGFTYNLKEHQDKAPVFIFRSGEQFDFEVEYTNTRGNDSLYLVSSREGIDKVIELKWDVKKGKYIYTGYFDQENTSYIPGKMTLYLEKGVAPSETIYSSEVQNNLSHRTAGNNLKLDSDGDGYPDIVDKHRNSWDVGDRDLAIFSLLSYKSEEEIKKIFLAKSFKDKGLKIGGTDQALFENWRLFGSPVFLPGVANINVYRFVNDKTKEIVLAIRGTDQEVRIGGNMGIEKPYLSPEWIDNYFKIWRGISKDKEVIKKSLNLLLPSGSDYDVSIVGHSRGSYLAYILASEMLKNRLIAQDYERIDSVIDTKKLIRGNLKNVVTFNGVGLAAEKEQMLAGVKGLIERLIQNAIGGGILGSPLQRIIDELSTTDFQSEKELIELLQSSGLTRAYSIIGDPVSDPFRNGIGIGVHPNIVLPRYEKKQLINPENGELSEHDIHNFLYYLSQGVRNSKNQFRGNGDLKSNEVNERISRTALTDFKFAIDPSGVVINDVSKNPITGATTTIYYRGENGEEILWDAGEYSQFNPLVTTVYGEYAWDVPEGFWKVKVSKEGYESKESDWLPVPPPQTEVHFNLKPLSYKIAYKVGDGILKGDVPRSYQTDVDTELPYPVRKGYVFTGWYLDDNFSGEPFFNTLFDKAGDKVLYAKWEKDTKILSDDDNVVTVTVSGNDVNVIGKVVKKEVTNADILEKVGDHNNLLMEIQALDDDGNIVSLSEDAKLDLAVISGRKPYKVLHYVKDKSTFEEVPFNWNEKDKNISLTTSTLGVYLIQSKLTEQQMTTKVRQESRVLKTDKVEYVDDASLEAGKIREVAAVDGQVLVEITDIYVNGELQSSTEKELSRIEPQSKKVYRGTKQVSQVPDVAPIEHSKPEAIIETKVRQESRVLKTDKIEYVDDASLDVGKVREIASVDGQVLVEITDIYVNGELQSSTEKELSRIEPQSKKVYRGTKQVSQISDVAPIEVNRIERNNITKEHQGVSIVINTKLEPVVMNQSSSEPLSSKETTIRTKGYLPNTSSEYGYGFEWAGIIALATAHFGIISNKRKKNIKN